MATTGLLNLAHYMPLQEHPMKKKHLKKQIKNCLWNEEGHIHMMAVKHGPEAMRKAILRALGFKVKPKMV